MTNQEPTEELAAELHPLSSPEEQALRDELIDLVQDAVPVVGDVVRTVRQAGELVELHQKARLREFIRTTDWHAQAFSEEQKEQAKAVLESEQGGELLYNYARRIFETHSRTVRAAMAILFGDELIGRYPHVFHRLAIRALTGLTESEVDLFLALADAVEPRENSDLGDLELSYALVVELSSECGIPNQMSFGVIDGFMNKGMIPRGNFHENFSQAGDFYTDLVWGETSTRFELLLRRAKDIVDQTTRSE